MCSSTGSSSGAPAWQPYLRVVAAHGAAGSARGWALRQAACPPCAAAATSAARSCAGPARRALAPSRCLRRPAANATRARRSPGNPTGRTSHCHQMDRMPCSLAIVENLHSPQDELPKRLPVFDSEFDACICIRSPRQCRKCMAMRIVAGPTGSPRSISAWQAQRRRTCPRAGSLGEGGRRSASEGSIVPPQPSPRVSRMRDGVGDANPTRASQLL